MPSITDSLTERGIGWAALCSSEVTEAIRICHICADTPGRSFQVLAAYFYIASYRYNTSSTASVTDAQVASVIPKTRGDGHIGADAYRKQIKPLLVAWGLVSCDAQKPTGKGRKATLYGFPMFEKLLLSIEPVSDREAVIDSDDYYSSDLPPYVLD